MYSTYIQRIEIAIEYASLMRTKFCCKGSKVSNEGLMQMKDTMDSLKFQAILAKIVMSLVHLKLDNQCALLQDNHPNVHIHIY